MATFDRLAAEQRAIIELVLQRGQTYDDLAGMLDMPATRVRDLARQALGELAPATAERVDDEWRGQVADYMLGQQSGPESTATRAHLKRSEQARTWALSLLDSLHHLYENGTRPAIPSGEDAPAGEPSERERPAKASGPAPSPRGPLSPEARAVVRRRRLLGLAALVVALAVAGFFLLRGDDDDDSSAAGNDQARQEQPRLAAQGVLRPTRGEKGAGIAAVFQRGGETQMVVQASGLEPSTEKNAYEVWLYNSKTDAVSVGAQVTDQQGNYQGAGPLPEDWQRYKFIDVSREPLDNDEKHAGDSVLRGTLEAPQPGEAQQTPEQGG